jgi:Nucleotidyl transferase AbiEii toxin, Type IV TA system
VDREHRPPGVGPESGLSTFHGNVLPPVQREALAALGAPATRAGFHLAGGTAVAIHLGHRQSIDLDWFTPSALDEPLALADRLRSEAPDLQTMSVAPGTLHAQIQGVRCSFLSYRYPLLRPLVPWPTFSSELASLEDLAGMKLSAVAQRGARKDFLDIHAIGRHGLRLGKMIELYQEKYGIHDVGHVLAGLSYTDDAEREPMPVILVPIDWNEVKTAIRSWVKEYAAE